jgi:hypothetical protein
MALLVLALALIFGVQSVPAAEQPIEFDIPQQPLASAIDAYIAVTGFVVVYNADLAKGRLSHVVAGRLPPNMALTLLLKDSGLAAEYTASDAFVVVPAPLDGAVVRTPTTIASAALSQQNPIERRYSGMVQERLNAALCARPETVPGDYRVAMRFWIGPSGDVMRLKLLGSTGDGQRDLAIADVVAHVAIGEPPPRQMQQPFAMIVLPRSSGGTVDCPPLRGG